MLCRAASSTQLLRQASLQIRYTSTATIKQRKKSDLLSLRELAELLQTIMMSLKDSAVLQASLVKQQKFL